MVMVIEEAATVRLNNLVVDAVNASVTWRVKLYAPAIVGLP